MENSQASLFDVDDMKIKQKLKILNGIKKNY